MKRQSTYSRWWYWGLFLALIALYNWIFSFSTSNDFPGLGMNCLLIEQYGLKYAVNTNWGFAHPGLSYLLTKVTGHLLWSQRLLTGLAAVCSLLILEKVVFRQLHIPRDKYSILVFALFLSSYLYMEMILSPHMDIIPATLLLWALSRLDTLTIRKAAVVGFVLGMSYWFRFHYLIPMLLFPALVFFYHRHKRGALALLTLAGVHGALAVPALLTKAAFGVWSISNQKALLGEMIYGEIWSCDFQYALQGIPYRQLWQDFNFLESFRRFAADFTYHTELSLPIFALITFLFVGRLLPWDKKPLNDDAAKVALVLIFLTLCILPLVFVRTATTRLMTLFLIPAFPFMWAMMRRHIRVYASFVVLLLLTLLWRNFSQFSNALRAQAKLKEDVALVEKYASRDMMRRAPELIYASHDFFNPWFRYNIVSPVLTYAWPCRHEPFREKFGVFTVQDLADPSLHHPFEYLIFTHKPTDEVFDYSREELSKKYELLEELESGTSIWKKK